MQHDKQLGVPLAILGAGAMIAAALIFVFRWEMAAGGPGGLDAYRLDRWTGTIVTCSAPTAVRMITREHGVAIAYNCERAFDVVGARAAGYSDEEIMDYIMGKQTKPPSEVIDKAK